MSKYNKLMKQTQKLLSTVEQLTNNLNKKRESDDTVSSDHDTSSNKRMKSEDGDT